MVISPFTRKHYVSHVPMDHTAIIKFVESRFIGPLAHLTNRDAAQPDLLDFFDFNNDTVGDSTGGIRHSGSSSGGIDVHAGNDVGASES